MQKYPSFTHIYFIAGWFRKGREALSEGSVFFKLYYFYIFFIFSSCFLVLRYFVKNCCVATLLCKKTLIVFVLHESSSSISLMHTWDAPEWGSLLMQSMYMNLASAVVILKNSWECFHVTFFTARPNLFHGSQIETGWSWWDFGGLKWCWGEKLQQRRRQKDVFVCVCGYLLWILWECVYFHYGWSSVFHWFKDMFES